MGEARRTARRRRRRGHEPRIAQHESRALAIAAGETASVLVLGLAELGDECWAVLTRARIRVVRVADVNDAVHALADQPAQVVIADARHGRALTAAIRRRRELAFVHVVLCAALDSPRTLLCARTRRCFARW